MPGRRGRGRCCDSITTRQDQGRGIGVFFPWTSAPRPTAPVDGHRCCLWAAGGKAVAGSGPPPPTSAISATGSISHHPRDRPGGRKRPAAFSDCTGTVASSPAPPPARATVRPGLGPQPVRLLLPLGVIGFLERDRLMHGRLGWSCARRRCIARRGGPPVRYYDHRRALRLGHAAGGDALGRARQWLDHPQPLMERPAELRGHPQGRGADTNATGDR